MAGTNGKGSVTAMTHAALRAAGLHAARYTSPHLTDLAERFVIGDGPVPAVRLEAAAADVLACADRLRLSGGLPVHPTFFEATTATAFELFRRAGVSVAVVEVGLGGRFDATNVIVPAAGAITTIDFDHQQHLGHSLEAIAFEKAGIIKPGMTTVVGEMSPGARAVIRRSAAERGATLVEAAADARWDVTMDTGRARLTLSTPRGTYGPVTLGLPGAHQVGNAIVAVRLLEAAAERGIVVPSAAIEQGLAAAQWPGRLELIPMGAGRSVLLDSAHNAEGARALAAHLRAWYPERPTLVLGVMRDKNVEAIAEALLPATAAVVVTAAPTPRAIPAAELAASLSALGANVVAVEPDPWRAVAAALDTDRPVCVAGSIFLIGAVRDLVRQRAILP